MEAQHADSAPLLMVLSPDGDARPSVPLADTPIHIGRDADNEVPLQPDPEQVISRVHCVLEHRERRWWVRDLDSRNHTYVERNGERAQIDDAELMHGDVVCILAESANDATAETVRHWRLQFSDPRQTRVASDARWLQYFPASETVWLLGGTQLPRRVAAPPKARRMLIFLLARHRERNEPRGGVRATYDELKAALWPTDDDPQIRADSDVANVAWELRKALSDTDQRLLRTESGGYRLVPRP